MTFGQFIDVFPDHDACLDYLKHRFYPDGMECPNLSCRRETKFHRITDRGAYSCQYCGHHVYPTAGTIFHKSTTSLQLWFWAIYLMSSTRCGISAKQLERETGVSYPTAHRMFKLIRTLLSDSDGDPLGGVTGKVEMDETLIGGKPRAGQVKNRLEGRMFAEKKDKVFGMVEREGQVRVTVIPDRNAETLKSHAVTHVLPETAVFTDEFKSYYKVGKEFKSHRRIKHKQGIYVRGDVHTNTIEGFFGLVKTGLLGTYHSVSSEYLQSYLDEYAFRYNRRDGREPIFWAILDRVEKDDQLAA